jgi:hypothetical protein
MASVSCGSSDLEDNNKQATPNIWGPKVVKL